MHQLNISLEVKLTKSDRFNGEVNSNMIIKISTFSNHIDFTNNELNVLEIEDKNCFQTLLQVFIIQ